MAPRQGFFQQSKNGNVEVEGGWKEEGGRGKSLVLQVLIVGIFFKTAKPEGDGTTNVMSAFNNTENYYTALPYQHAGFGR